MKAEPSLRRVRTKAGGEAGRNRGEGVSHWTGRTGRLPREASAGCGGGSEVAAEERGGRGKRTREQRGGKRAPSARVRAPSARSRQAWASHGSPGADGADGRAGVARPSAVSTHTHTPTPEPDSVPASPLRWRADTCFLSRDLGVRAGEHVSLLRSPFPHDEWGGRSWACGESAPGFPAHFNSVSASAARRFTPPGAPEPSAGTRSASPTHPSLGMRSGRSDLLPGTPSGWAALPRLSAVPTPQPLSS